MIGLTEEQAIQKLQADGFAVKVDKFGSGSGDRVWDYSPVGPAARGSTITIDILRG